MTYNPGTDSYESDFLEPIIDTGFRCNIPYKIDRDKYKEILEKNHQHMRIVDADVVVFGHDYCMHDDGEIWLYNFFAWPKNSPEGSDDFYDCFQFDGTDTTHKNKNIVVEYHNFIRELMGCVIGIDMPAAITLRNDKAQDVYRALKELDEVDNIIMNSKA